MLQSCDEFKGHFTGTFSTLRHAQVCALPVPHTWAAPVDVPESCAL